MKKLVSLSLFTVLAMVSCTDYSAERKQVADLMDELDKAKKVYEATHPDSLTVTDDDINDRVLIVMDHYDRNGEIIDKEIGIMMGKFKGYRKAFKGLASKRVKIGEELDLTYAQLSSLDEDLKNRSLKKDKVTEYLEAEKSATTALTDNIYRLDTLLKRGAEGFYKYVPRVDSLMTSFGAPK